MGPRWLHAIGHSFARGGESQHLSSERWPGRSHSYCLFRRINISSLHCLLPLFGGVLRHRERALAQTRTPPMLTEDYVSNSASTVRRGVLPLRNTERKYQTLLYCSQLRTQRNPNQSPCFVYETSTSGSDSGQLCPHDKGYSHLCAERINRTALGQLKREVWR